MVDNVFAQVFKGYIIGVRFTSRQSAVLKIIVFTVLLCVDTYLYIYNNAYINITPFVAQNTHTYTIRSYVNILDSN